MSERIVVFFSSPLEAASTHLARATALRKQAEALGARLCAWAGRGFAFDFAPDELEEAVALAMGAADEAGVDALARFAVGVAQGDLQPISMGNQSVELAWGDALSHAEELSALGRPGEVWLHSDLPSVSGGELLYTKTRRHPHSGVRGAKLDIDQPWRTHVVGAVTRMVIPPFHPRTVPLQGFSEPGKLAVLVAARGTGGTRWLKEWLGDRARSEPTLYLAPIGLGHEPLSSLRAGISRARIRGANLETDSMGRSALAGLLSGRGCDLEGAAAVLVRWLGGGGAIAIDDAEHIDDATLRSVRLAASAGAIEITARVEQASGVPEALASLPRHRSAELEPLGPEESEHLALAFMRNELHPAARRRYARRAAGHPLAIQAALAHGLVGGDLAWRSRGVTPRRRTAGYGPPLSPRAWMEQRVALLLPPEQLLLASLAVLGGDARSAWVAEAVSIATGQSSEVRSVAMLAEAQWIQAPQEGTWRLASRTSLEVLLASVETSVLRKLQKAAARVLRKRGGALAGADASRLLSEAGEDAEALEAAVGVVAPAQRARLSSTRDAMLEAIEAVAPQRAKQLRAEIAALAKPATDSNPRDTLVDDEVELAQTAMHRAASSAGLNETSLVWASGLESEPPDSLLATQENAAMPMSSLNAHLSQLARDALRRGDVGALSQIASQLHDAGAHPDVVGRLRGLAALGRGEKDEALRTLRDASVEAGTARAQLAYAVALGGAGRREGALLEALRALASARRDGDEKGASACALFLAKLSGVAGHPEAATRWAEAASGDSASPGD